MRSRHNATPSSRTPYSPEASSRGWGGTGSPSQTTVPDQHPLVSVTRFLPDDYPPVDCAIMGLHQKASFLNNIDNNRLCVKPIENIFPSLSHLLTLFLEFICQTFFLTFIFAFERFSKAVLSYFKLYSLIFPLKILFYCLTFKNFNPPRIYLGLCSD